jgi:hypothetical protein
LPNLFRHQLIQRLHQVGHIATPDRLCRPGNLKALALKNVFQPVQGQIIIF